jgi:hypothetical protein
MYNPNCDYANGKCCVSPSEIRILPLGGEGNIHCCRTHYNHEMVYRRERNKNLSDNCKFDLPPWNSLEIYKEE